MTDAQEKFLGELYSNHHQFLRSYCRRKVGCDQRLFEIIEESIQDTFFQAYKSYSEIKDYQNVSIWLMRTCMNRLMPRIKRERKKQKLISHSLDQPHTLTYAEEDWSIEQIDIQLDSQLKLDNLCNSLSPHESSVFQYHFILGYSIRDTAMMLGVTIESVKAAIVRIRHKSTKI